VIAFLAGWIVVAAVVVAGVYRFGRWLDSASDPDRRTRWNREAGR
jgi:hypothetical protein